MSRNAAVLRTGLDVDPLVRAQFVSVVADRECGAAAMAAERGLPVTRIDERDNAAFSDALAAHCEEVGADFLFLFFGRLLRGGILERYENRIVNIHPALLPSFKGLHGFRDTVAAGARFLGVTFHLIDANVDEGRVILQSVVPVDTTVSEDVLRHRQFEQMCKGFVQVCHWLQDDRVQVAGAGTVVAGARFDQPDFSPALDAPEALGLSLPPPA